MYNTTVSFGAFTVLDLVTELEGPEEPNSDSPLDKQSILDNGIFASAYSGIIQLEPTDSPVLDAGLGLLGAEVARSTVSGTGFSAYSIISKFIALSIATSILL